MYGVGRNNPRIRAALVEALELGTPGCSRWGRRCSPACCRGTDRARRRPVRRCLFTSSGSESVESAIKLGRTATGARASSPPTTASDLTLGATSVNGNEEFKALPAAAARCSGSVRRPRGLEEQLRRKRGASSSSRCRAGHQPAAGRLPRGSAGLCRRYGTLFCVDEVMTGLGRTGRIFAFQHWGSARPRDAGEAASPAVRPRALSSCPARCTRRSSTRCRMRCRTARHSPNELAMAATRDAASA